MRMQCRIARLGGCLLSVTCTGGIPEGSWAEMMGSFALLRTHREGKLCGIRVGRWHINLLHGTLHVWRDGMHRYWTLPWVRI